jgi:hypothetical protein
MILNMKNIMDSCRPPWYFFTVVCLFSLTFSSDLQAANSFCGFVGKKITLRAFQEKRVIPAAVDEDNFDKLVRVISSGNNREFAQLLLSGKIFELNDYVEALVLTIVSSRGGAKVKVLEGPYAGKNVWVDIDCIDLD